MVSALCWSGKKRIKFDLRGSFAGCETMELRVNAVNQTWPSSRMTLRKKVKFCHSEPFDFAQDRLRRGISQCYPMSRDSRRTIIPRWRDTSVEMTEVPSTSDDSSIFSVATFAISIFHDSHEPVFDLAGIWRVNCRHVQRRNRLRSGSHSHQ